MTPLTILVVQAGGPAQAEEIRSALPAISRRLSSTGGFWGIPFQVEIWTDIERTQAGSVELARRVAAREDIAAVLNWGGTWLSRSSSLVQQEFLDRTSELPVVVLSGSTLPEHARHPGSFSLAPARRLKTDALEVLVGDIPPGGSVGWICDSTADPQEHETVRAVCERRGVPMWTLRLPGSIDSKRASRADWERILGLLEDLPLPTHWFNAAFAFNRPLAGWQHGRPGTLEVVQLNTGPKPDWVDEAAGGSVVFWGGDGWSEQPDILLSRELQLSRDFPRLRLDALLLLQQGARLAPKVDPATPRRERFERWVEGLRAINGSRAVFVGTRAAIWFDPETRSRRNGAVVVKQRELRSSEAVLHPVQVERRADGSVGLVPVAYVSVDLLSMEHVSVERQDAELDFYLDVRCSEPLEPDDLRFLNTKPSSLTMQPILQTTETENGRTVHVRRFRVHGTFSFVAEMRCYPADAQTIEIVVAPSNPAARRLHLQPPPRSRLDREFSLPGWRMLDADVSVHTRFWQLPTNRRFDMRHEPYPAVGFHWMIRRRSKDTILFVAVPMSVLLGVSYFAGMSDLEQADGKVNELTGAMLATIALYFATTKPRCDESTILDRSFRMAYILIGGLLATILVTSHFAKDAYEASMRGWLLLFPAFVLFELLHWRRMVRRQAQRFEAVRGGSED